MQKRHILKFLSLWPPYLGAGVRVKRIDPDLRAIDVEMKLRFWNSNYVGSHFGGSLFSMVDPFYMLMLIENLGPEYVVWDKSASIRFRRPAKGTVRAEFRLTEALLDNIRENLAIAEKYEPLYTVEIKDGSGTVVAEVEKVLHIRKREAGTTRT
jgi:hypothetical protein